jgi:hypothetical protein
MLERPLRWIGGKFGLNEPPSLALILILASVAAAFFALWMEGWLGAIPS